VIAPGGEMPGGARGACVVAAGFERAAALLLGEGNTALAMCVVVALLVW
jgi:hypothetical protein